MKGKKGFSLIEIIIFCFISFTLLTLFVGLAMNSREFARTIGCVNNMKNIAQAIELFQADFNTTPSSIEHLHPMYIENASIFKCPADRTETANSYDPFYIGRFISADNPNNIFLACPRHHKGTKTVAAYLSYAVDSGKSLKAEWSGTPAEFGQVYTGGQLSFTDGTTVEITDCSVGLLSSFVDNTGRPYSIIYTMDGEEGSITVNKPEGSNSNFEVITPAVIAGVEGTKFDVINAIVNGNQQTTTIRVSKGQVKVEDRKKDVAGVVIKPNETTSVAVDIEEILEELPPGIARQVPRKPLPPGLARRFGLQ